MKLRQSKLFSKIDNSHAPKPLLTKKASFEIDSKNCDFASENIPKLIIRRKTRQTTTGLTNDKKSDKLIIDDLPKLSKPTRQNDPGITNDKKSNKIMKYELPKLSNTAISEHIARCSKFSKFIDCQHLFENFISKINFDDKICWTNLYSPKTANNFLVSNIKNIMKFKNWLESWDQSPKSSKPCSDSENSDFESDQYENLKPKSKLPHPIFIICGHRGVGKSSLVYAISAEINYTVFETNCSSRRTGKDILNKLENAAHNQQIKFRPVTNKTTELVKISKKKRRSKENLKYFEPVSKKLKLDETLKINNCSLDNRSLFLFDDVDVVMDEDKGLFKAICSLVEKRPVILTVSDKIELKKVISQLGKNSYVKIHIEQSPFQDIAIYLQLILLSRGLVVQHGDMLQWMFSSCSTLDLRSCLNNLQFAFVNRYLDFKPQLELFHWDHYKIKHLSANVSLDDKDDSNCPNNVKLACVQGIHSLSSHLNFLQFIDNQIPFSNRRTNDIEQRDSTIDLHCLSQYDNNRGLSYDIRETLVSLSNKNLHQSMNSFEKDILLTSLTPEFNKIRKPQSVKNKKHNEIQNRITESLNVRCVVSGVADRLDRLGYMGVMATLENNRKSNFTQRRFKHYFDRIHLQVQDSDLKYLTAPFKNN